ncbi:hypothetical protein PanWU01x14_062330 [Parasponia andersonii]|uniref:Zinc finger, CCHC-type n=1 Tax=Parasponia andersonii TaxID=3476 RepID=A0A2P5DHI1_PARAD|nr:hypothetical protein PanWU01x14_062330 [Parasponia andersonii]
MVQNQEMRIDQAHSISLADPHSVNLAQKNGGRSGFSNNGDSNSGHYHNGGRGNHGGIVFRGGPRGCGGHRPLCQICSRVGHLASRCYSRFDPMYLLTQLHHNPLSSLVLLPYHPLMWPLLLVLMIHLGTLTVAPLITLPLILPI